MSPADKALLDAAKGGDVASVSMLLQDGAELESVDKHGKTPLLRAAKHGRTDVVELLITRGANITALSYDARNCLHLAAAGGHVDALAVLLRNGAAPLASVADGQGHLPADVVPRKGGEALLTLLQQAKAGKGTLQPVALPVEESNHESSPTSSASSTFCTEGALNSIREDDARRLGESERVRVLEHAFGRISCPAQLAAAAAQLLPIKEDSVTSQVGAGVKQDAALRRAGAGQPPRHSLRTSFEGMGTRQFVPAAVAAPGRRNSFEGPRPLSFDLPRLAAASGCRHSLEFWQASGGRLAGDSGNTGGRVHRDWC